MKETISDIIREMRDEVRTSRENNPDPRTRIFLSTSNMAIEDFADRLEAADAMEREAKGCPSLKANDGGTRYYDYRGKLIREEVRND